VSGAATHLSIEAVVRRYGANTVLKGISLDIRAGEFIALVGPSGCGKSTLLRIIAGLESADEGHIRVAGDDVTHRRAADRDVAMVFQSYALYPHLTARQNMAVPLVMRRMTGWQRMPFVGALVPGRRRISREIAASVEAVAESLKMTALLDRKPAAMSGGQRQRVALGRAIVREPKAFLMDEPLSNLDAALRVHTRSEIVDLHRRLGATTVYVTHDQEEALSMADRVAVMRDGRLLQVAAPRAIYDDPDHVDVAEFIGSPRINLVAGEVDAAGHLHLGGAVTGDGYQAWAGKVLRVGFRPEHARIVALNCAEEAGVHYLGFGLDRLEFLGAEAIAHGVLASGESVLARVSAGLDLPSGAYALAIPAGRLLIFTPSGDRIRLGVPARAAGRELVHG
jgi:multiple sugar transport system ATP-binding protein